MTSPERAPPDVTPSAPSALTDVTKEGKKVEKKEHGDSASKYKMAVEGTSASSELLVPATERMFTGIRKGHAEMDPHHCVVLQIFDEIQHAVLESPDQTLAHVIYSHYSRVFVENEMMIELFTRSGLGLVLAPSLEKLISIRPKNDIIVVLDSYSSGNENALLKRAVKTYVHLEVHTLFLQQRDYRPKWVDADFPHCTLMVYPWQEKELLPQFWESVVSSLAEFPETALGRKRPDPRFLSVIKRMRQRIRKDE